MPAATPSPESDLRVVARDVFEASLAATDPSACCEDRVRALLQQPIWNDGPVAVLGLGKAARALVRGAAAALGGRRGPTLVLAPGTLEESPLAVEGCDEMRGEHPIPGPGSLAAGARALEWLGGLSSEHRVLFLVSGGGSSCCEAPRPPLDGETVAAIYERLVVGGAPIARINTLRRALSHSKGGGFARAASHCIARHSLYHSDVDPGDLDSVAAGPTRAIAAEPLTPLVEELGLPDLLPRDLVAALAPPLGAVPDGDGHELLLDQNDLLTAAAQRLGRRHDFAVRVDPWSGEEPVQDLARRLVDTLRRLRAQFPGQRVALIAGGETSCPVHGSGRGGRNQEFVLHCAELLRGEQKVLVFSAGSDGVDGNSPAAGALADGATAARAEALGLSLSDALAGSDSYSVFDRLQDAIVTGPTGNNLRDLRVLLAR